MADNGTIEIKGLDERIKQLGEASTKNPMMRKRINEVIRRLWPKCARRCKATHEADYRWTATRVMLTRP